MEESGLQRVRPTSPSVSSRWHSVGAVVRQRRWEIAFTGFVLVFAAALRFTDTNNVQQQLLASSYLVIGRNPYAIFPFPPPPGLFLAFLPAFGAYVLSGYSLTAATLVLKVENLAALLFATAVLARTASTQGALASSVHPLKLTFLLSPLLFFVSFVWVEQDILGIALALAGVGLVLASARGPYSPWQELLGFALLAFSVFVYYFPALLVPTLLVYSRNRSEFARRLGMVVATLGAFALWFWVHPGWDFVSSALGVTNGTSISVFSPFVLFGTRLFASPTGTQLTLVRAGTVVFFLVELLAPLLLRWRGFSVTASAAIAMILPFLLLNILNGDEFVWPLPFVLLALASAFPASLSGWRLAPVQAYAAPMVVLANIFDAPGPGTGTGIFYFGYPQFHRAVALNTLLSDPLVVAQALAFLSEIGLVVLLLVVLLTDWRGRTNARHALPASERAPKEPHHAESTVAANTPVGGIPSRWDRSRYRGTGWRSVTVALAVAVLVVTLLTAAVPAPEMTVERGQSFPTGLFASYPVVNASLTYGFVPGKSAVAVVPSLGNGSPSGAPGNLIEFLRNVHGERFSLEMNVSASAPAEFPYNVTILEIGTGALSLVRPFSLPSGIVPLSPLAEANSSLTGVVFAPQFVGALSDVRSYEGSSYTEYGATPLGSPGGQVTLWFRLTELGLLQSIVAAVYDGATTYEVFGVGDQFFLGVLRPHVGNWTFSSPQTLDPRSWHELTITNTSGGFVFELDGMMLALAPSAPSPSGPVTLFVGALSPNPAYFDRFAFIGSIAGPFNTTGVPVALGDTLVCSTGFGASNTPSSGCVPFSGMPFSIRSGTGFNATVVYGATSYTSDVPAGASPLAFGRLSPIGPGLEFAILSFDTTTSSGFLSLAWAIDGAVVTPVFLLGLLIDRFPAMRRRVPPDRG